MKVIYPDEIFLVNSAADYVILLMTAKMTGTSVPRMRILSGALLGGAYSAAAALWPQGFLSWPVMKIVSGAAMCLAVFSGKRGFIKLYLVFMALSAGFAGAVMAASLFAGGAYDSGYVRADLTVLVISFAVCSVLFSAVFRTNAKHRINGEILTVTVTVGKRKTSVSALRDTGNTLRDPVTGMKVIVCDADALMPLFDGDTALLLMSDSTSSFCRLQSGTEGKRFRLVPYRSVGRKEGLLLCFRPDSVTDGSGREITALIGVSPEKIGTGDGYSAVAGF